MTSTSCTSTTEQTTTELAVTACEARVERLRELGFNVTVKTFGGPVDVNELIVNIGGDGDTTRKLTYRVLLLTESAWLDSPELFKDLRDRILGTYRQSIARGKFMPLLLNELNRYYRTLLVDYRYKIEESGKSFGDRNIKLRHSRKLWYLANLTMHCTARVGGGNDPRVLDGKVVGSLDQPSLVKLTQSLADLGEQESCRDVWRAHDFFLGRLCDPEVRRALEAVDPKEPDATGPFKDLKQNADRLQEAAIEVIEALSRHPQARAMLMRYGLL